MVGAWGTTLNEIKTLPKNLLSLSFRLSGFLKKQIYQCNSQSDKQDTVWKPPSDLVVLHFRWLLVGIAAMFQIQIVVGVLLRAHRLIRWIDLPKAKHEEHEADEA